MFTFNNFSLWNFAFCHGWSLWWWQQFWRVCLGWRRLLHRYRTIFLRSVLLSFRWLIICNKFSNSVFLAIGIILNCALFLEAKKGLNFLLFQFGNFFRKCPKLCRDFHIFVNSFVFSGGKLKISVKISTLKGKNYFSAVCLQFHFFVKLP